MKEEFNMKSSFKKIISLFLSVLMVLSLCTVAFAAEDKTDLPIVYIAGRSARIYAPDGTCIYPRSENIEPGFDEVEYTKSIIPDILKALGVSMVTDNWDTYSDTVYDLIAPLFEQIQLDENADPEPGTKIAMYPEPQRKTSNFQLYDYQFQYDWRIDPCALAEELAIYIDKVLAATGASQVEIVGRCLGSTIVNAYLEAHGDEGKVKNVVFHVPTTAGSMTIGALFSGQIEFNAASLDRYVAYYMNDTNHRFLDTGDETTQFIAAFSAFITQAQVMGYGADVLNYVFMKVRDNLVKRLVRSLFFFPTYWAMIDDTYYEDAKTFVFGEEGSADRETYKGYIEKIDNYHYTVQKNYQSTLTRLHNNGMNISVIAKYGGNLLPVNKGCDALADGRIETSALSFGATCSLMHTKLSASYIEQAKENGTDKYISADRKIDASTCLFPDSTWFVRGLEHASFPQSVDKLILFALKHPGQATVWENENYPQYLDYDPDTGAISPVTGNSAQDKIWTNNFFEAVFRFFTSLLRVLTKLIMK